MLRPLRPQLIGYAPMVSGTLPSGRSSMSWPPEESGGWSMIEVRGEGVAESSAGSHEVVAGERGGVGSRHDARMGEQSTVGGVGLGRKDIESHACEVSGVEVGEGGVRVEEGTAGDVDEPGPGAHRSEHSVVNEGRLPDLIAGGFDDGIDFGDAFEEPVGSVEGGEGRDGPVCRLPRCMRPLPASERRPGADQTRPDSL
jgi:hypothetical protein